VSQINPCYGVRRWDTHFENSESRRYKHLRWVPMPNKHDGRGYKRLVNSQEPAASEQIFCAWNLICQVASKMPVRGILADDDGPLTAEDMAHKTGFRQEIFATAFAALADRRIGWLYVLTPAEVRQRFGHLPEVLAALGEHPPEPVKGSLTSAALRRVCAEIAENKRGWHWDVCKVPRDIAQPPSGLLPHLEPFTGRLTEAQAHEAWSEAVQRTHAAMVDDRERAKKSPGGYCCRTWGNLMQEMAGKV